MKKKILRLLKNPSKILLHSWIACSKYIKSDVFFLKVYYFLALGKKMDFDNPKTYSQKIQYLKLYNNSPVCTQMVDKYGVRELIKEKVGDEYLIPLYGVWSKFDDIDFKSLPNQFVLKTTHDSGSYIICKDKSKLDLKSAKRRLNSSLRRNYFWRGREYPYKNVEPRIIAEKLMTNENGSDIVDYKFYCFNGVPKIMFFASDRQNKTEETKFDYYDMDLNHLPIKSKGRENAKINLRENKAFVESFQQMKELSKKLSDGFPHLRVDLYYIRGDIYFGELTFHDGGGIDQLSPESCDVEWGDMIKLPLEFNRHE